MIHELWLALRGTHMQSAKRPGALALQPINPAWIREGSPQASATMLTQTSRVCSGIWECTAGSFDWTFDVDEVVQILEGEVHVESEGKTQILAAGTTAFFPCGLTTRWHVPKYVKKFFTHQSPGRVLQLAAKIGNAFRKGLQPLMVAVAMVLTPETLVPAIAACL